MSTHAERLHYGIQEVFNQYEKGQRANLKALSGQVHKLKKTMTKQFSQVEEAVIAFTKGYVEQTVLRRLTDTTDGTSVVDLVTKYDTQMEDLAKALQVTSPIIAVVGGPRKLKSLKPDIGSCSAANLSKVAQQRMEMMEYMQSAIVKPYERTKNRLLVCGRWKDPEESPFGIGSKKVKPGAEVSPMEPAVSNLLKELEMLQHQLRLERDSPSIQQTQFAAAFASGTSRRHVDQPPRDWQFEQPPRAETTSPRGLPELKSNFCLKGEKKECAEPGSAKGVTPTPERAGSTSPTPTTRRGFGETKGLRNLVAQEKERDRRRFHGPGAQVKTGVHRYITDEPPAQPKEPDFDEFAMEVKTAMRHKVRNTKEKVGRFLSQVIQESDPLHKQAAKLQDDGNTKDTVTMLQPTSRNTMGTLNSNEPKVTTRDAQLKDHAVNRMMERRLKRSLVGQQY